MRNTETAFLVSTDLDGTLLDHYSYSWAAAEASLSMLESMNVPVVINTSKTRDEVVELQTEMGINAPFIVENGSAIYFPKESSAGLRSDLDDDAYAVKLLGEKRANIISKLTALREEGFHFESYSDWTTEQLVEKTGLSTGKAEQSKNRLFSEPLIWLDAESKLRAFSTSLERAGLKLIKGGRFYHVLGNSNKGKAIKALENIVFPDTPCELVCLGDSYNDLDMLKVAHYAVLCKSPAHEFPKHNLDNEVIYTEGYGPEGWHQAISKIFKTNEK